MLNKEIKYLNSWEKLLVENYGYKEIIKQAYF